MLAVSASDNVAPRAEAIARHTGFQAAPAHRSRVADHVFEELLRAILHGELKPGEAVPTQRALSVQFGVSPLVVRQAIHRLEELQLVRVRQGSTTIVLDPNEASDVRLIELQLAVASPGDALALAGIETRTLSALPLIVLAERRISDATLDAIDEQLEQLGSAPSPPDMLQFEQTFWLKIAEASCNPLLRQQLRWWIRTLHGQRARDSFGQPSAVSFYRELAAALRQRSGAVALFLQHAEQICDWLEGLPGHTMHAERPSGANSANSANGANSHRPV
jgi:DNA-binding FadR family transcriptional regulator